MPRQGKISSAASPSGFAPYPSSAPAASRKASIWTTEDDETLSKVRAQGMNWQPISDIYFPNKSANACRKRHERLIAGREIDDWDARKLEHLAEEYEVLRQEMWETLAYRMGERWQTVEAKCMEKGHKWLKNTARAAHRRTTGSADGSFEAQGTEDQTSDSGIGMGSDTEMEVGYGPDLPAKTSTWPIHSGSQQPYPEHARSHSLPQPLALYQPPPPPVSRLQTRDIPMMTSPTALPPIRTTGFTPPRTQPTPTSPESQHSRGALSIQSMLSPVGEEPK